MRELVFTFIAPFGGSGAGALGFLDAHMHLQNYDVQSRFECRGGFDIDPLACKDFEYLTGVAQVCAAVQSLTASDVRRHYGTKAPDCVFTSAPCQGGSALLRASLATTQKYQDLNELGLIWTRLMLAAWDQPPALMLFENVPKLRARAPEMLRQLTKLLKKAGYVLTEGFHDCGEIGGLAQHRERWLLVARQPRRCPPLLYQPPRKRVRGCGEVLAELPVPATVEALAWGPMHQLPKLQWRNWLRLALIPAGGDWRDLEGVLAEGQQRREIFKRHAVEDWSQPVGTVAGAGSNGVANIADPRVVHVKTAFDKGYAVLDWQQAASTIATRTANGCGAYAVADPRIDNLTPTAPWEGNPSKAPPYTPIIMAQDGTWHRPLTTLELAALQGFPLRVAGQPLQLAGGTTRQRRAIGNAVPPPAARAIAEKMLLALTEAALGSFSLCADPVWVAPLERESDRATAPH